MRKPAIAVALSLFALTAILGATAASAAAAPPSPWVGTWVLDPAKSKIAAGRPTNVTRQFTQADPQGLKYTFSFTTAQGQTISSAFVGKADGKPYAVPPTGTPVAQVSYTWASARVLKGEVTQNNVKEKIELTLSADGKSIVEVRKRTAPAPSEETLYYVKK